MSPAVPLFILSLPSSFSGHLLEKKFLSAIKESASQPSIQGKIFFIPTFYVFPILRLCRSKCKPFTTAGDDTSRLWKRIYQEIVKDSLKRVQPTSSDPMQAQKVLIKISCQLFLPKINGGEE